MTEVRPVVGWISKYDTIIRAHPSP